MHMYHPSKGCRVPAAVAATRFSFLGWEQALEIYHIFVIIALSTNIQVEHMCRGQLALLQEPVPQTAMCIPQRLYSLVLAHTTHNLVLQLSILFSTESLQLLPNLLLFFTHTFGLLSSLQKWGIMFLQSLEDKNMSKKRINTSYCCLPTPRSQQILRLVSRITQNRPRVAML